MILPLTQKRYYTWEELLEVFLQLNEQITDEKQKYSVALIGVFAVRGIKINDTEYSNKEEVIKRFNNALNHLSQMQKS